MFFTLFGPQTRICGSLIVFQFSPHLLNSKLIKRVPLDFVLTSVGLALHGWLFRNTHVIGHLELKTNNLPEFPIVQGVNSLINIFLINATILYQVLSSNIYQHH